MTQPGCRIRSLRFKSDSLVIYVLHVNNKNNIELYKVGEKCCYINVLVISLVDWLPYFIMKVEFSRINTDTVV